MRQPQLLKGFTLIELLLYMSLAMVMLAVLSGVGANVLESRTKAKAQEEVQYTGQFMLERIAALLEEAESITQPSPQASSSVLILQMENAEENPTIIRFQDESVQMQKGDQPSQSLVGNTIAISELQFHNVTQDGRGAVRIVLDVEAYNPKKLNAFAASTTLYTTINLRP